MKPTKEPEFLTIDQYRLDAEWLHQPRFFYQYAKQLADARRTWEEAKANLKIVAAEVDKQVRQRAAQLEEKTTEAAIAATILRNPKYREAEEQVFDAKHLVDLQDAAVETLRHRKDALENLVRLRLAEYYSEPKAEAGSKEMMADMRMRSLVRDRKAK